VPHIRSNGRWTTARTLVTSGKAIPQRRGTWHPQSALPGRERPQERPADYSPYVSIVISAASSPSILIRREEKVTLS
jgi:hypothetical protein